MHYVIFSALYRPSIGGVENFTEHIARELAAAGHRVTVVTSNVAGVDDVERDGGVTVVRLPCHDLLGGRLPLPRRNARFRQLWQQLEQLPCDGVLVNTRFYPHSVQGARYARSKGLTPVVLDHGSAYLTLGNPMLDTAIKLYEHAITAVIKATRPACYGVSQKSCAWLRTFGIEARGVIPNAIDADAFRDTTSTRDFRHDCAARPEQLLVAFVGRLVPEKGVSQLVEAARMLHEQQVDCMIALAGDGPLRGELERIAPPNVRLLGPLDKADVAALLLQADLLCLPSRSEGFGAVLLEAAACETPAAVTAVGVAPELITDDTLGMLLPTDDAAAIAEALSHAARHRAATHVQGTKVCDKVRTEYSWQAAARSAEQALRRAVASVPPRSQR